MKIIIGDYKASDNKDYYTLIIDKVKKEIFAMKNFSCLASNLDFLSELYKIEYFDTQFRFSAIFSGTEIDINKIPKKYQKFTILNN